MNNKLILEIIKLRDQLMELKEILIHLESRLEIIEPCPFCQKGETCDIEYGGEDNKSIYLRCVICGYSSMWFATELEAINAHNAIARKVR